MCRVPMFRLPQKKNNDLRACDFLFSQLNMNWKVYPDNIKTLHQLALLQVIKIFASTFVRIGWEYLENSHGRVKKWNSHKSCPHLFLNSTPWMSTSLKISEADWWERSKLEHRIFKNKHKQNIFRGRLILFSKFSNSFTQQR